VALPELFVLVMTCFILMIDVFIKSEQRYITYRLSQLTLLGAALLVLVSYGSEPDVSFNGHYVRDTLSDLLKIAIFGITATVFLYSRDYLQNRRLFKGEYFILGLFGVLGMQIMVSAHSFLTIYLGLELLSLTLYALVAFDRDSPVAAEAAMKYFVLGALASGMLLYGISMIYGATGTLDINAVAEMSQIDDDNRQILAFGLVFLVVGLAFKLGAVPFHMWLPDVYQGAPASMTLYIGSAPKLAAFALVIRVLAEGLGSLQDDWWQMLVVMAMLSLGAGNIIAIVQQNIKRLLAYSTIAHVGFILLGVATGTPEGYSAALFYTLTYVLMAVGAFGIIIILSQAGVEAEYIDDYKGLNDRSPWLAFLMLLIMMSMAGLPLLIGFYAKLMILQVIIKEGWIVLAVFSVLFSVVGAFYYLRVVKCIYFDPPECQEPIIISQDVQVIISANGLLILALGLYPTVLISQCMAVFSSL